MASVSSQYNSVEYQYYYSLFTLLYVSEAVLMTKVYLIVANLDGSVLI